MTLSSVSLRTTMLVLVLSCGTTLLTPIALAQDVQETTQTETTASEPQQGSDQGTDQGTEQGTTQGSDQGSEQGGPSFQSLGITPDENGNYDTSSLGDNDPRQGAQQGQAQGVVNGTTTIEASNAQTGADSTNTSAASTSTSANASTTNTSATDNTVAGAARTGLNAASENTGPGSVNSGSAGVGVQQVTADNLTTTGSQTEVGHSVSGGSQNGDLVLEFTPQQSSGSTLDSFRSTNEVTGSNSDNTVTIESERENIVEIQNDGTIDNNLRVSAITGQNDASQNTGDASIGTGDANVAATLLNFLNTNVVDGTLWLEVADIFGDLNGNVVIPEEAIAYLERRQRELLISAANAETGSDSTNTIDVDVNDTKEATLTNVADVQNAVTVDAITGQNTATQNTGGSAIQTGDVDATTNTVTLANMNVVDSNLGLIIVNAFNRWLAYLLGSDGTWSAIDHEYATEILAENTQTGADSTNTIDVDVNNTEETTVKNTGRVNNNVAIEAITGQNTANQNTGDASIKTGNARVNANIVNVVNTNVIRGNLFIAVVNVFGNWVGDLLFGGHSIGSLAHGGVTVQGGNTQTGADSTNTIDVDVNNTEETTVENTATIANTFTLNADTGHNETNRNTGLGSIDTGDALAALHARNVANLTALGLGGGWGDVTADLTNATTGADSTNTIDVTVNDERNVTVINDATVDTAVGVVANTGFNTANRNTLGGLVRTGLARIDAFIENLLNQTWLIGNAAGGDPHVAVTGTNQTTGANSTNANTVTPSQSTTVDLTNTADVSTTVDASATTGHNQANENTGDGTVDSGKAGIAGALDTAANQTETAGAFSGSLALNLANAATIANTVNANASTGENETNRNTGAHAVGGPSPDDSPDAGGDDDEHDNGVTPPAQNGGNGGNGGNGQGGNGGGDDDDDEENVPTPQVKSATTKIAAVSGNGGSAGEISAVGPIARFFLPRVAQAAEPAGEEAPQAPARFPTAGGEGQLGVRDFVERAWPWTLLAAAAALLMRVLGGWTAVVGAVRRRGQR